nr:hypothetical protein L204_05026 [Cryptococcus depauperatus CBS 7855]
MDTTPGTLHASNQSHSNAASDREHLLSVNSPSNTNISGDPGGKPSQKAYLEWLRQGKSQASCALWGQGDFLSRHLEAAESSINTYPEVYGNLKNKVGLAIAEVTSERPEKNIRVLGDVLNSADKFTDQLGTLCEGVSQELQLIRPDFQTYIRNLEKYVTMDWAISDARSTGIPSLDRQKLLFSKYGSDGDNGLQ